MIQIVCDSTFGIEEDFAKENNIKIVNLKLILDDLVTSEGKPSEWGEFYGRLANSKNFPTTSQPNPNDFISKINEIYDENPKAEIFIFTISNTLSGTINSATLAASEFKNKKITAIDSGAASVSGKLFIDEILSLIKAGQTYDEILATIPQIKEATSIQFVPATMEYLKRGGRVGKLAAIVSSVLNIKPIFYFKNGTIKVIKKTIGLGHAVVEMISNIPSKIKRICACYIYDTKNVPFLTNKLNQKLNINDVGVLPVSPVLGCHIGIGTIGIATLAEY